VDCSDEVQALLMHMTVCHPRLVFTFEGNRDAGRICVSVDQARADETNPDNDLSKIPYQLEVPTNDGWVVKKRPPVPSLQRFADNGIHSLIEDRRRAPAVRKYYHTQTMLAVTEDSADEDSEGDEYMPENFKKLAEGLNDFSDVNDAEKRLMVMWNIHIIKHPVLSDRHIVTACKSFVMLHVEQLRDLKYNFRLHLATLCEFGIIASADVAELCAFFDAKMA
jgi:hypothetical protein